MRAVNSRMWLCLMIGMVVCCVGLAPSSKVQSALDVLKRNGFEDARFLAKAVENFELAQKEQAAGDSKRAQEFYLEAAKAIVVALHRNEARQGESAKTYDDEHKLRLLDLVEQYQLMHRFLEEAMAHLPEGSISNLPKAMDKLPAMEAFRSEIDSEDPVVKGYLKLGDDGLEKREDQIQQERVRLDSAEERARYSSIVELLKQSGEDVAQAQDERGKTRYRIPDQAEVQGVQREMESFLSYLDNLDRVLEELKALPARLVTGGQEVPEFPVSMTALDLLHRPLAEIAKVRARGDLASLLNNQEAQSSEQAVRSRLRGEIQDVKTSAQGIIARFEPYARMLENIAIARDQYESKSIVTHLRASLESLRTEWTQATESFTTTQEALRGILKQSPGAIAKLRSQYKNLSGKRRTLQTLAQAISPKQEPRPKTSGVAEVTRTDLSHFRDFQQMRPGLTRELKTLRAHQKEVGRLSVDLLVMLQNAVRESLKDTDFAAQFEAWLAERRERPLTVTDCVDWYRNACEGMRGFLTTRVPLISGRVKTIRGRYDESTSQLGRVHDFLETGNTTVNEKLRTKEPLAKRLGRITKRKDNGTEELRKAREALPQKANSAIERAIRDP